MTFSESIFYKVCSLANILRLHLFLVYFFDTYVAYILFYLFIHSFPLKRYIF